MPVQTVPRRKLCHWHWRRACDPERIAVNYISTEWRETMSNKNCHDETRDLGPAAVDRHRQFVVQEIQNISFNGGWFSGFRFRQEISCLTEQKNWQERTVDWGEIRRRQKSDNADQFWMLTKSETDLMALNKNELRKSGREKSLELGNLIQLFIYSVPI